MTDPKAPQRLLDDPQLSNLLSQDLQLASAHSPLAYNVSAGLARFEQSLAAGATPATVGGAALGVRVLAWFLGGSVIVGSAIGASALLDQAKQRSARAPVEIQAVVDQEPVRPAVAAKSPATTSTEVAPPDAMDAASSGGAGEVASADAPPQPHSKPVPVQTPSHSLADEAKRINAARKALQDDPAKALQIVEATAKQFPNGAMVQEREGYAVLALAALGRSKEAQSRGRRYLERWPNGTLARRVNDAIN